MSKNCEICGGEIDQRVRWHRAKTCSLPCSQELERQRMRRWYDNNLEAKKEYDRKYRKAKKQEQVSGEAVHVEDEG